VTEDSENVLLSDPIFIDTEVIPDCGFTQRPAEKFDDVEIVSGEVSVIVPADVELIDTKLES
jgi:hypothetical protein